LSRLFIFSMVLAILLSCSEARSQETPSAAPPLTLMQAAKLTLEKNPRLQSASFGREAAAAQIDQAALQPQWSVDLQVQDFAGTGTFSGLAGSETTLSLSRIFQPSAIRSGRMSIAVEQRSQLENELEVERLDLMTLLARRFEAVVHEQEQLRLAARSVGVWLDASKLVQIRERAGAAPAVDRLRTEIRVENARMRVESVEQQLRAARFSLAATWGDLAPTFGRADANLCSPANLASFEIVAAKLDHNPDLLRFASAQRVQEARAQLAKARRRPDWTLSAGVRSLDSGDEQALVFGVSVPLGSPSRAAPAIRRANALRQRSEFNEQAARLDIQAALHDLYLGLVLSGTQVQSFDEEIIPRARAIQRDVADGYLVGRFSHLELVNSQAELLAAHAARLTACSDHQLQLIDIERLTGGGSVWLATQAGVSP